MLIAPYLTLIKNIFFISVRRYFSKKNIYYKLAFASLPLIGISISPNIMESIVFFFLSNKCPEEKGFYSFIPFFITIALTLFFAHKANQVSDSSLDVIQNDISIQEIIKFNHIQLFSFQGSILNLSKENSIEVIVSSENSMLLLGDINGPSLSGKLRRLVATFNQDASLQSDNLFNYINSLKQSKQYRNVPLKLGATITNTKCVPRYLGVKAILHAITLHKESTGEIHMSSIANRKIIHDVLSLCKTSQYKSVLIPIFGIGSGKQEIDKAIHETVNALYEELKNENYKLKIYIATYRIRDTMLTFNDILKKFN